MKTQNVEQVIIVVDSDLKNQAETLFGSMGMSISTALNVFLRKAVDESLVPFVINEKSTGFGTGISVNKITDAFTMAVQKVISESRQKGFPVARYDKENKQAYLEMPDGKREYVNE